MNQYEALSHAVRNGLRGNEGDQKWTGGPKWCLNQNQNRFDKMRYPPNDRGNHHQINAAIGSKLRGLDDEPWLTVTPLMRPTACERSGNQ
jgi:hypothetical protein